MQIPNPAPVAKGLAVAAAALVGIPAVCRAIEAHPALGFVALLVLVKFSASQTSARTADVSRTRLRSRV